MNSGIGIGECIKYLLLPVKLLPVKLLPVKPLPVKPLPVKPLPVKCYVPALIVAPVMLVHYSFCEWDVFTDECINVYG